MNWGLVLPNDLANLLRGPHQLPVELAKVDPRLAPGEKASVQIDFPDVKDVLILPIASVQHGRVHLKDDDDSGRWANVITGAADEQNVEIKSGLREGDEIFSKEN